MEKRVCMFGNSEVAMLIGQIMGIVAVILGFINYQVRSQKALLLVNMITCIVFCIHYLLIGAVSGFALNAVGVVRNIVYSNRDKKIFASPVWPIFFGIVMLVAGIITWQDWRSFLAVAALVINSLALSLKNPQHIRYSLLLTCPMVLIYDLLVSSYGGMVYEGMSTVSAIIGIIRFRKIGNSTN